MRVRWFGQSAFALRGEDGRSVFVDPFPPADPAAMHGLRFDYPPIEGVQAELLLITHEHFDHNGASVVGGAPRTIRSTAGTFDGPGGAVVAVASEHDAVAGTQRGPNAIMIFPLDGRRVCHFGDFGQSALRPEQAEAVGRPDLLLLPVGGGPTIDGVAAAELVRRLRPRWVVPMHYRTPAIDFLGPVDGFLEQFASGSIHRLASPEFDTASLPPSAEPLVVVPAVPTI